MANLTLAIEIILTGNPEDVQKIINNFTFDEEAINYLIISKLSSVLKLLIKSSSKFSEATCCKVACMYDYLDCIKLLKNNCYNFSQEDLRICITSNSNDVLIYLLKSISPNEVTVSVALSKGSIRTLEEFKRFGLVYHSYHCLTAAEADREDILIWLINNEVEPNINTCMIAGPKTLRLLCTRSPLNPLIGKRIIEVLRDVELCIKLYTEKSITSYDLSSMLIAVENGDIKIVKWLYGIGIKITPIISLSAARHNQLRILDWLYSMDFPIERDETNTNADVNAWFEKYEQFKASKDKPYAISSLLETNNVVITRRRSKSNVVKKAFKK